MTETETPLSAAELVKLARRLKPASLGSLYQDAAPIAGSPRDQLSPDGVDNPLWEIVRHIPASQDWHGQRLEPHDYHALIQPGFEQLGRHNLAGRFSWSIPSPGDMAWLVRLLDGRGVVEIGAGSGYWAWQMAQAGIDVLAYDPELPGPDNRYVKDRLYHPVLPGDDRMAAHYPERALLLCWPPSSASVAFDALTAYTGDLLVYIGESEGGCTADDDFFKLLDAEWELIDESPSHVSWYGIHCWMTAWRRRVKAVEA